MKKLFAPFVAILVGLMTAPVMAGDSDQNANLSEQETRVLTPVIKIIALSGEQARQFNETRARYKEVRSEVLDAQDEYLDRLLADVNVQ